MHDSISHEDSSIVLLELDETAQVEELHQTTWCEIRRQTPLSCTTRTPNIAEKHIPLGAA